MPAPAKNPEDMRRILDKRKTPLDASWVLLSAGAHQRAEVFPKDPLARIAPVEADPPPREVACGTLGRTAAAYKDSSRGRHPHIPFLLATTRKIKVMGENRKVGTELRNYVLIEIQNFSKTLCSQTGEGS